MSIRPSACACFVTAPELAGVRTHALLTPGPALMVLVGSLLGSTKQHSESMSGYPWSWWPKL